MPLKRQLLLLSLLFLSLPWAGCQFVREVESALRHGQEQSLQASSSAIASALQADHTILQLLRRDTPASVQNDSDLQAITFHQAPLAIIVDGYLDEDNWDNAPIETLFAANYPEQTISYRALNRDGRFYLYFEVRDQDINYYNPASPNTSDQLILVLGGDEDRNARVPARRFVVASSSPGRINIRELVNGQPAGSEPAISAYWQDTVGGYNIEVSLPITLSGGRIGFYRHDVNRHTELLNYGSIPADTNLPPHAVYTTQSLAARLQLFRQTGQKLGIVDRDGRKISEQGSIQEHDRDNTYWALRSLYTAILQLPERSYQGLTSSNLENRQEIHSALQGRPAQQWYRGEALSNRSILGTAVPLFSDGLLIGAFYVEQSSEEFLALTDNAFNRIFLISFAVLLVTVMALLAYASWLSLRIRRLSQAAQRSINADGSVRSDFADSSARDEIGDLGRNYGKLLRRVEEYTDYLQSLSRKLSHELRTPLAVVETSLENLEREVSEQDSAIYVQRARDGTQQLTHILAAMSEATRVEESIESADRETTDLIALLTALSSAYADLYSRHQIVFQNSSGCEQLLLALAPELIVQMLDKLVENATDFAPEGSQITITCGLRGHNCIISVSNEGRVLEETLQSELFKKMVSLRNPQSTGVHLGLGLHIVKLIAEFHNGSVRAYNLVNGIGVCFEVDLPLQGSKST